MNNKNLIILISVIFSLSIVVILFLKDEDEQLVLKPDSSKKTENNMRQTNVINNDNTVIEKIRPLNYEDVYKDAHINQFVTVISVCGFDYKNSQINKDKINQKALSGVQAIAKNYVAEECENWYDFLYSLTESEYDKVNQRVKNEKSLTALFYNSESFDNEMFQNAYGVINGRNGSSGTTTIAMAKLLTEDFNLMNTIAKQLGTKDLGYFINNHLNIAMLYSDSVFPSESTANSLASLNVCALNENMCGLSASQYIATTMTPNQYIDLVNVIDIIENLVRDGYFEQYDG